MRRHLRIWEYMGRRRRRGGNVCLGAGLRERLQRGCVNYVGGMWVFVKGRREGGSEKKRVNIRTRDEVMELKQKIRV